MYTILLIVLTSKCTIHVWKRQRRRLVDLIQILQHVWMTMFTRFLCGIDHWISRWFSANQIAKKWDEYSLASSFKTNLVIQLHDVDCAQSGNSSNVNSSIFLLINFLNQIDVKMLICQWKMWRSINVFVIVPQSTLFRPFQGSISCECSWETILETNDKPYVEFRYCWLWKTKWELSGKANGGTHKLPRKATHTWKIFTYALAWWITQYIAL